MAVKLYNIGVNYNKANVKIRSDFSLSIEKQQNLLLEAKAKGIEGIIVVSTCNRTEITGFANHPFELIKFLCDNSNGTVEDFVKYATIYKGNEAVQHLFEIASGLKSQILGDYEIIGQLKKAYLLAQKLKTINTYLEKLINLVLQASKKVKNQTVISSGTTTVAYAATQYIVNTSPDYNKNKILIYGLGKIGTNTCKNLLKYNVNNNIHIINRTHYKSVDFSKTHENTIVKKIENLDTEITDTDILIVSTGAESPTITLANIPKDKKLLILDLSIPKNVSSDVLNNKNVSLVNVDELSVITDKTLSDRKKEIPKVQAIITTYREEFNQWLEHREFMPAVNELKKALLSIQNSNIKYHKKKITNLNEEHAEIISSKMIEKITAQFVKHLKNDKTSVNQSIDVVGKIFNNH